MRPFLVVALDPRIEIGLKLGDRSIDLLAEDDAIELIEHRLVEALDDAIRLWALGLGAGVVDVLERQVELVFVVFRVAAIFRAAIGQHAGQLDLPRVIERHDAIVEEIGGGNRRLPIIELGEGDLGVGVDEGLLVDAPDPLHGADVERVLGAAIARAFALEFAMRLLFALGLLQRGKLALGQNQAFLGDFGFEGLQSFLHRLKIMALPDPTNASRRDRMPELAKLVGDADLAISRPAQRKLDDDRFDLGRRAVLQDRLSTRQLLQRQFAAGVVKLLEAIETVARIAHHFASLADIAELPGQLQKPNLGADDFLFLGHDRCPFETPRPGAAHPNHSAPGLGFRLSYDTNCQIKS